jgi:hypothetical protein
MIVCKNCTFENADDDEWCGGCRSYLKFDGELIEEPKVEVPQPLPTEPETDTSSSGLIQWVKDHVGGSDEGAAATATPGTTSEFATSSELDVIDEPQGLAQRDPSTVSSAPASMDPAVSPSSPLSDERPSAYLDPVTPAHEKSTEVSGSTGPVPPAPVKDDKPSYHRPSRPKAEVINPGDLICGECGVGNGPERKYCRSCGAPLHHAEVFTLPWYRRLWRMLTRRKAHAAGERPHAPHRAIRSGGKGWLSSSVMRIVALALVVGAVLYAVGPLRHPVDSTVDTVVEWIHPTYVRVYPVSASATSSAPGHPPKLAIDNVSNTSWQTGSQGDGAGDVLRLNLAPPADIDKIGFLSGDSDDLPGSFLTEPRPRAVLVELVTTRPGGTSSVITTKVLALTNSPNFQTYTVPGQAVSAVVLKILTVWPSKGSNAAIAEVEPFTKK